MADIPDDILELIFLHLASPAHLIRATSTCRRWHGIVACAQFLSRFHSLNARHLVAGCYYNGFLQISLERECPTFVVSSSSDGSRFSLDFLWSGNKVVVDPNFWRIVDCRGGLDEQGIEAKVVAGRDGEPRVIAPAGRVLRVFAMRRGGDEWELEKTIELSAVAAGLPGYLPSYLSGDELQEAWWINVTDVAMVTVSTSTSEFMDSSWSFRLDLETLEAELVDMART